jgi:hypothetical protein
MSTIDNTQLSVGKFRRATLLIKIFFFISLIGVFINLQIEQKKEETDYISYFSSKYFKLLAQLRGAELDTHLASNAESLAYLKETYKERAIDGFLYSLPFSFLAIFLFGYMKNERKKERAHPRCKTIEKTAIIL